MDDALPLRVDAYLALNGVHPGEHYGNWYTDRAPGPVGDRLARPGPEDPSRQRLGRDPCSGSGPT